MIDGKEIMADFQFVGNRVSLFNLKTKMVDIKGKRVSPEFEYDYTITECKKTDEHYFGVVEFIIKGKARAGRVNLFNIDLIMEGAFVGHPDRLTKEKFEHMLEQNGIATLSQISRSFILSVTSQSGIKPPVRLPMVNVIVLNEKKKKEKNEMSEE